MAAISQITSQSHVRGLICLTVRIIAGLSDLQLLTVLVFSATNHNQRGDPKKGANVIIDLVKGEGAAKDREFTPVVLLGSDCYDVARSALTKAISKFDEWKDVTISTDRDDA